MCGNEAAAWPPDRALVTAAQWFAGGQRIPHHPYHSQHPDLLAAAIPDIASRHGVAARQPRSRT
jgi:hypothetical protein